MGLIKLYLVSSLIIYVCISTYILFEDEYLVEVLKVSIGNVFTAVPLLIYTFLISLARRRLRKYEEAPNAEGSFFTSTPLRFTRGKYPQKTWTYYRNLLIIVFLPKSKILSHEEGTKLWHELRESKGKVQIK